MIVESGRGRASPLTDAINKSSRAGLAAMLTDLHWIEDVDYLPMASPEAQ